MRDINEDEEAKRRAAQREVEQYNNGDITGGLLGVRRKKSKTSGNLDGSSDGSEDDIIGEFTTAEATFCVLGGPIIQSVIYAIMGIDMKNVPIALFITLWVVISVVMGVIIGFIHKKKKEDK